MLIKFTWYKAPGALLLMVLALTAIAASQAEERTAIQRKPVEFSPSVVISYVNDVILHTRHGHGQWAFSRCLDMVYRASQFNAKRLNFVVTSYFLDTNGDAIPESYCMKLEDPGDCHHLTEHTQHAYFSGLKTCISKAVELGLDILITPRLDDGSPERKWRNALAIDPLASYGEWSYSAALATPLAQAVGTVIKSGMKLWFCLEGQMNLSVMKHPAQYVNMYNHIKDLLTQGENAKGAEVQVGLCLNYNKLTGMNFLSSKEEAAQLFDVPRVVQLFDKMDFLGMTSYPTVMDFTDISAIETTVLQLGLELALVGVSLADFAAGRELLLVEYGYGGGINADGMHPVQQPQDVGLFSYWGILGVYQRGLDPWMCWEWYGKEIPTKTAVRQLYNMTAEYLKAGGGARYRIDGMFLWNVYSWDLLGIHWQSYSAYGSYYETGVVRIVKNHNAEVNSGAQVPFVDWALGRRMLGGGEKSVRKV